MTKNRKVTLLAAIGLIALIGAGAALMHAMSRPAGRTATVNVPAANVPATQNAYPHAVSTILGQLHLMRQARIEADIPDDVRRQSLAMLDDARTQMTRLLENETASPTTRDTALRDSLRELQRKASEFVDPAVRDRVREQSNFIWLELDLLSRRQLLPLMFKRLELTPEQKKSADKAFMEVSVVLRAEPAGGLPNERSMQAMLTGRDKLHALLTPAQRDKFMQVLQDEQQSRRNLRVLGAATKMATTAPTTRRP